MASLIAGLLVLCGCLLLGQPRAAAPLNAASATVDAPPRDLRGGTADHQPVTLLARDPGSAIPGTTTTVEAQETPPEPTADLSPAGLASALATDGIPATALDAYQRAAASSPSACRIDWALLAAIGRVETDHGRFAGAVLTSDGRSTPPILGPVLDGTTTARIADTDHGALDGDTTFDRAVGPMQFIPSTWRAYARDGNGDGTSDPFNIYDAAAAAASYLCAAGGDLATTEGQVRAVLAYNHSDSYVTTVLGLAASYAGVPIPQLTLGTAESAPALPPVNPAPPLAAPALATPPVASTPAPAVVSPTAPPTQTPSTTATAPPVSSTAAPASATPTTSTSPGTSTTSPSDTTPPPATTPPPTSSTSSTAVPSTTTDSPSASPTSESPPCDSPVSTPPGQLTVDIIDGSGNAALVNDLAAQLESSGAEVGSVTETDNALSAIQYPAADLARAASLADALGIDHSYLQQADVQTITVMLGSADAGTVFDELPSTTPAATPDTCATPHG